MSILGFNFHALLTLIEASPSNWLAGSERISAMTPLTHNNIESFSVSAIRAAAYLDACDSGTSEVRLDARYYQACAQVLQAVFVLLDPQQHFPVLLEQSSAAREMAESLRIARHMEISRLGYYPALSAALLRAAA
jgi:hypothetical protein